MDLFSGAAKAGPGEHPSFSLEARQSRPLPCPSSSSSPEPASSSSNSGSGEEDLIDRKQKDVHLAKQQPQLHDRRRVQQHRREKSASDALTDLWPAVPSSSFAPTAATAKACDWATVIGNAVENAQGKIELTNSGVVNVPAAIADLNHLVALAPREQLSLARHSNHHAAAPLAPVRGPRAFNRVVTEPTRLFGASAPLAPSAPLKTTTTTARTFGRTKTAPGSSLFSSGATTGTTSANDSGAIAIELYLGLNALTSASISPRLFELKHLRVLSLRHNRLDVLSASIANLKELTELNVAGNRLRFLPAEILNLPKLKTITFHPNRFAPVQTASTPATPTAAATAPSATATTSTLNEQPSTSRVVGEKRYTRRGNNDRQQRRVASLVEVATRLLLAPSADDPARPVAHTEPFLSLLPAHLRRPFFSASEQQQQQQRMLATNATVASSSSSSSAADAVAAAPFDRKAHVCDKRSPAHVGREVYYHEQAVERLVWVREGALIERAATARLSTREARTAARDKGELVPLLFRGCSATCLDWLDDDNGAALDDDDEVLEGSCTDLPLDADELLAFSA